MRLTTLPTIISAATPAAYQGRAAFGLGDAEQDALPLRQNVRKLHPKFDRLLVEISAAIRPERSSS